MAEQLSLTSKRLHALAHILLIAIILRCATSARILDEDDVTIPVVPALPPQASDVVTAPVGNAAPAVAPAATTTSGIVAHPAPQHSPLSFFMHDVLGGSAPSGRIVSGIISSSQISNLPFSKPNGGVFPLSGGVPLITANSANINNNNNLPFIAGLNGGGTSSSTVIQNNGNNNAVPAGNTLPFVTAGQLPPGATLQKLMFGTITVIDDELTKRHEVGSSVIGKAQGFYFASSSDSSSQTMAFTTLFHSGDHEEDTISFFGVHRTAEPESQVAVVGGTGKYENARGYATIETLHLSDQHTTDGVETLLHFSVYLSH